MKPAKYLNKKGRKVFRICLNDLKSRGEDFDIHYFLLQQYCFAIQLTDELREKIQTQGLTVDHKNKNGFTNPVENPLLKIYREVTAMALALGKQFGFTPCSRQRLKITVTKRPKVFDLSRPMVVTGRN